MHGPTLILGSEQWMFTKINMSSSITFLYFYTTHVPLISAPCFMFLCNSNSFLCAPLHTVENVEENVVNVRVIQVVVDAHLPCKNVQRAYELVIVFRCYAIEQNYGSTA